MIDLKAHLILIENFEERGFLIKNNPLILK